MIPWLDLEVLVREHVIEIRFAMRLITFKN